MNNDLHDFERFMKWREDAARAYVDGDAEPVSRISTQNLPRHFPIQTEIMNRVRNKCLQDTYAMPNTSSPAATAASRFFKWQRATV